MADELANTPPSEALYTRPRRRRWPTLGFVGILILGLAVVLFYRFKQTGELPIISGSGGNQIPASIEQKLQEQSKIKKFASFAELETWLDSHSSYSSNYYGGNAGGMLDASDSPQNISEATGSESKMMAVPSYQETTKDYSSTNVQVEGVDEADIVKTDGDYIYAVSKQNIFILQATPPEKAKVLAKIEFKLSPQDIYLNGDYLVVFGNDTTINKQETYKRFPRRSPYTFVKIFNISDRKNPKVVRDLDFEGNYYNSRMIGDYMYFLTQTGNYRYYDDMPLPVILENGERVATPDLGEVYYFGLPYESYNFTHVAAINLKDQEQKVTSEFYVLDSGQNMYVSEKNIYLTYTKRLNEEDIAKEVILELVTPQLSAKDQAKIKEIQVIDTSILSDEEKLEKIGRVIEEYGETLSNEEKKQWEDKLDEELRERYEDISKELEKTVIHKIAIDKSSLEYKALGEATGHVLNQFSMDEHDGYFRIATTKNRAWSLYGQAVGEQESYSNLYIFDANLKVVGKVEDLAKGERIYSVRFMQGRAYMVTFKQTDPLFVIDVSQPTNPKVLGQLKIPGFSTYLHPYDDTTLIGFGRDADEDGRVKGLKLGLFDVSDVSQPKELNTYVFEGTDRSSDSLALNDHKAFLFSEEKNLLVLPVNIRQYSTPALPSSPPDSPNLLLPTPLPPQYTGFYGAYVFQVDKEDGFKLRGKISHSASYYDSSVGIKRSLFIKDSLYTVSDEFLKINQLENLAEIKLLELKKEAGDDDDFKIVN